MSKNKIIALVAIGAVVIVFIIFAVTCKKSADTTPAGDNNSTENQAEDSLDSASATTTDLTASTTPTTSVKTAVTTKKTVSVKAPGAVTQSYADALKTYSASGYRMQFVNCKASPGSLIIKKGKTFMLDNRDNKSHKIKVGSVTYTVGAYGYAIATARTLDVNYVLCDGAGAAKITVEP